MQHISFDGRISLLGLWLLGACSSGTDQRQPITSTPDDYCQRSCEKAHACDDTVLAATCRSMCEAALASYPKLRADFLGYAATCVQASGCSHTSASKCASEAEAQLPASDFGKSFCTAYVEADGKCDATGSPNPESTCLAAAKSYDDSALKSASNCFSQSCAELGTCLERAIPDITLAL
jgi:hypothetical protein